MAQHLRECYVGATTLSSIPRILSIVYTTVKLTTRDKQNLERLRAELSARAGRRLTQQETLALLLSQAQRNAARLAAELAAPDFPVTDAQMARIRKMRKSWGVRVLDEGVDKIVYG